MPAIEIIGWKRKALYGAFFALAFVFALQRTFPSDAVKERVILEAAAQGWQIQMDDVSPSGFGVHATNVVLESREGTRLPLDEVSASLRLLPLIVGTRSVRFDARVFEGRVEGVAEQSGSAQRLVAKAAGIDLARAAPLRKASGLDLGGQVSADIDVTLDEKDPAKSTGHIDLAVEKGAVNGGSLPIAGMTGGLTLPRMGLGTVSARAAIQNGQARFEKLEARGEDVDLTTDGLYFVLQPRLEYAPLYGRARLRIADAFWQKSGTSGMRGIVEMALAQAKGRDGYYTFQLYGSLGHPQARPVAQ